MSNEELNMVKSLIEQCMLHYLNKNEVIDILYRRQRIDPSLTRRVWEKLEEQNEEFFKGYYLRVLVNQQIREFNYLLEKQAVLMNQLSINDTPPMSPVTPPATPPRLELSLMISRSPLPDEQMNTDAVASPENSTGSPPLSNPPPLESNDQLSTSGTGKNI